MSAVSPSRTSGPAGAGFAQRMSGLSALGSGVQVVGQNLVGAATGGALGAQDAAKLDLVDKTRTFIMMNAIFDAANAPVVDRY